MLLKRKYKDGVVSGIQIKRFPVNGKQHLSPRVVNGGLAEGWLSITDAAITIHDEAGDLVLNVDRAPGRYCCHCGDKLRDDDRSDAPGVFARKHVQDEHPGTKSPDSSNPAGYEKINYFECTVEK